MRSARFFFGLLIVVVISTTYIFVGEFTLGPRFNISNDSTQNVTVIALWRNQSRDLGIIESGSTISLTVRDEASMVFNVSYADGRKTSSTPVYFSSGQAINVSITQGGIDVQHDLDN